MGTLITASRASLRVRYLVLLVVALLCAHAGYESSANAPNDWVIFEVGARLLGHFHGMSIYGGNRLHAYADYPIVQIGPPALLPVVATQWMSPHTVNVLWVVVMTVMGVASIGLLEAAAGRVVVAGSALRRRLIVMVAGVPVAAAWGYESGQFHHLDDALALLCVSLAVWLCASGRSAWLVGIALGVAIATKPWTIVAAPLLLGLPREGRAKACMALFASAAAFWAPFVISAPQTINALGLFHILPRPGSILWLFGVHGEVQRWLRPVQFVGGAAAAAYVASRGRWVAAPLVGLAVRVGFDPYAFGYYGLGPVLSALAWDLMRPTQRRLPIWTAWTLFVEFGMRLFASANVCAVGRLVWVLSALGTAMFARATAPESEPVSDRDVAPTAALVAA